MEDMIEKLKDPHLVAAIQKFFGVHYIENKTYDCAKSGTCDEYINQEEQLDEIQPFTGETDKNNTREKVECLTKNVEPKFQIDNKFWYYLFLSATYIGDELGYAIFLPFWFWNINNFVGKKIILVWSLIMYVGQAIKDVVCWPRPASPPVIRLQQKWSLEYGMPSTHAMVSVALPASVIYFTSDYDYPVGYAIGIAVFFCFLISTSRLYLGMHCVLDIIAGILLSLVLLIPIIPVSDALCDILVQNTYTPFILLLSGIILILLYPVSKTWTPTRGDTTTIIATCVGVQLGCWTACQYNVGKSVNHFASDQPSLWKIIGVSVLRTLFGYIGIIMAFIVCKGIQTIVDLILKKLSYKIKDDETKRHITVLDLGYKYGTYIVTAFVPIYVMPLCFSYLNIGKENYFEKC